MTKLIAKEGKVFDFKEVIDNQHLFAKTIYLGVNDSADNYIEVDESARNEWEVEQIKKQKEEELRKLLAELYPSEGEE